MPEEITTAHKIAVSFKTKHVSNFITHASNRDQRHDPCPIPTAYRISSRNIHAKLHYIQEIYSQKTFWSQETPGPRLYPQELAIRNVPTKYDQN